MSLLTKHLLGVVSHPPLFFTPLYCPTTRNMWKWAHCMWTPTRGKVTPPCCSLSPLPELHTWAADPLSTLLGLHWRHGNVGAVSYWLAGWRFRRLVWLVADLSVGHVVFCRLDNGGGGELGVSTERSTGKISKIILFLCSTLTLKWESMFWL